MGTLLVTKSKIKFAMWPKDHPPPHLHVSWEAHNCYATIEIITWQIIKSKGFNTKELKELINYAKENKEIFENEWQRLHS